MRSTEHYSEYFPRIYDHPTLNELLFLKGNDGEPVHIIERIGNKYHKLGIHLLDDSHGTKMEIVVANENRKAEAITREMLTMWINGQGIKDIDWKTLIDALRTGPKLNVLADDIVLALKATSQVK